MKYEMKKHILRIVFAMTLFAIGFQTANAQDDQDKRLSSSPKSFQTFFAQFREAIEKDNKAALVKMTKFPFKIFYDSGNENMLTKSEFVERFDYVIDDKESDYFIEDNPDFFINEDKKYVIFTEKGRQFIFEKKGKSFKFVSLIVEI